CFLVAFQQTLNHFAGGGLDLPGVNRTAGAVDAKWIAFGEDAAGDGQSFGVVINLQGAGPANTDLTHLTGHQGRVRTHAAARGENAFGGDHAAEIFGRGFHSNQQDLFPTLGGFDSAFGVEVDLARGGAGAGRQSGRDGQSVFQSGPVEDRGQDLV